MHDRERAQDKAPDPAAERAPAAAANVPAALALQRKIGNRAFGQLVARATPEESVEMIEPVITSAHADVDQISRTFLPFSKDQEGFDKMAEAYETEDGDAAEERDRVALRGRGPARDQQARAVARLPGSRERRRRGLTRRGRDLRR